MSETDCLFCKIVKGEVPADIVREGDRTIASRDINPQAPTPVLVVPRDHHPDVASAAVADSGLIDEIVRTSDDLDAFDAEVAIGQAISGLAAAARHWAQETGTSLDAASRGRLDELLARVTATWPLGS